jgi:hypothetical protein
MPDYVLNRSSFEPLLSSLQEAQGHAISMLRGLAALDAEGGDLRRFRMHSDPWTIPLVQLDTDHTMSLCEAINRLYDSDDHGVADYFFSLQRMIPTDAGLTDEQIEAILGAEEPLPLTGFEESYGCAQAAGMDAAICAVSQSVLASLPRGEFAGFDRIGFRSGSVPYTFDHVALPEHGTAISARQSDSLRRGVNRRNFWDRKDEVYCNLIFGRDVRHQVDQFAPNLFNLVLTRLDELNRRTAIWQANVGGPFPDGICQIRPESRATMDAYGDYRRFRKHENGNAIFQEHVWIDRGSRIHLIRDLNARTMEIGYIGPHLPTVNFGM